MELFPLDIIAGAFLVLSLFILLFGIWTYRYRGGKGPLILIISSVLGIISSVIWILELLLEIGVPGFLPWVGSAISIVLLLISIIQWRK